MKKKKETLKPKIKTTKKTIKKVITISQGRFLWLVVNNNYLNLLVLKVQTIYLYFMLFLFIVYLLLYKHKKKEHKHTSAIFPLGLPSSFLTRTFLALKSR
jgi:hypothetical protein